MDRAFAIARLRDLNYIARTDYKITNPSPLWTRFILLNEALAAGTFATNPATQFPDAPTLLGMMAATDQGKWWQAVGERFDGKPIISWLAGEMKTTIAAVSPPGATPAPTPTPVPTPTPTPTPGESIDFANLTVDQLKALAAKLAPFLPVPLPTSSSVTVESEGEIHLRSNLSQEERQEKMTHIRHGRLSANGWDNGVRLSQNWRHEGTDVLPYSIYGGNSRGSFESNWFPAARDELGRTRQQRGDGWNLVDLATVAELEDPAHPMYDVYRGQGFIVDQGAQPITAYGSNGDVLVDRLQAIRRRTMIGTQRKGWPLAFVVSPVRPNGSPVNYCVAWCDSNGSPNPWSLVFDGALRRLVPFTVVDTSGVRRTVIGY